MTLGKKLSYYRKVAGITQQQLAEQLNLSAQAISKWENDMSYPDPITLKTLARLYNTTVDELLDVESLPGNASQQIDIESVVDSAFSKIEEHIKTEKTTIGFCKTCGIAVNEDTVYATEPTILCKKCRGREIAAEKARQKELEELEKRRIEKAERRKWSEVSYMRHHRKISLIWASILAIPVFIFLLVGFLTDEDLGIHHVLIPSYAIFAFVFSMFYDSFVRGIIKDFFDSTMGWGLSILIADEFILFFVIQLALAIICFIIGIFFMIIGTFLSILVSMFTFPFTLLKYNSKINAIAESDPLHNEHLYL